MFDYLGKWGVFGSFFMICIFAPLFEEYIFRDQLRKKYLSLYFVFISISLIIGHFIVNQYIEWGLYALFLISAIAAQNILVKQSKTQTNNLGAKCFPLIFYFTAVVFGLVHLSNFKGLSIAEPFFIVFVASQIFGGLALGYLRIKYGLKWSILFHGCFNFVAVCLSILFPNF